MDNNPKPFKQAIYIYLLNVVNVRACWAGVDVDAMIKHEHMPHEESNLTMNKK